MRLLWGVVAACVAGCGGAPERGGAAGGAELGVEYCPESISDELPAEPPLVEWWTDRASACPAGTQLKGMAPPMGEEVWCETSDGTRYGPWTWWYGEGKPISQGAYNIEGEPDGAWVAWFENGKRKMQGSYRRGKQHGRWTMWHENGAPSTDILFEDGVKHGIWTWWYESGNKAGQGEFLREKPHGRWTRCADDGYITKVEIYDNDVLVSTIDYDRGRRVTASY